MTKKILNNIKKVSAVASVILLFLIAANVFELRVKPAQSGKADLSSEADLNALAVQGEKILAARCIACHSCNSAPCQLKLTSPEGILRGLSQSSVYNASRLSETQPTRLDIDAHDVAGWRKLGFSPVVNSQAEVSSYLQNVLKPSNTELPNDDILKSNVCPVEKDWSQFIRKNPEKGMPYGLPALTPDEQQTLHRWLSETPVKVVNLLNETTPLEVANKKLWEDFLNENEPRHQLVSRYLFEHLFTGSLELDPNSHRNFRIYRSLNSCDSDPVEISTRRPTDDPQGQVYYCLKPNPEINVEKSLIRYRFDQARIAEINTLFFTSNWTLTSQKQPDYSPETALNPFVTYKDIPAAIRYQFLLNDSQYHVATFIKGPVCHGNSAVNSIDEHFFVFFMRPESDLLSKDPNFSGKSRSLLSLPAQYGSPRDPVTIITAKAKMTADLVKYRDLKMNSRQVQFPKGYQLDDLWDGAASNPHAVLTVFRNGDNAEVLNGARGGMPTSVFVLDYSLFERLVYNLVVGFDVFGNLDHQLDTRVYMGLIRREAESNFFEFLPPNSRDPAIKSLYQDTTENLKAKMLDDTNAKFPTQVSFKTKVFSSQEGELLDMILHQRLNARILGVFDPFEKKSEVPELDSLAQIPQIKLAVVQGFPDSSLILVQHQGHLVNLVSLLKDKAHSSLGAIMTESFYRTPENDKLAVVSGLATSFPNLFWVVEDNQLSSFASELTKVKDAKTWQSVLQKWGVPRTSPRFWQVSDQLVGYLNRPGIKPNGVLDYTRYGTWTEKRDKQWNP